jgi:hypothetical protein
MSSLTDYEWKMPYSTDAAFMAWATGFVCFLTCLATEAINQMSYLFTSSV